MQVMNTAILTLAPLNLYTFQPERSHCSVCLCDCVMHNSAFGA